MISGLFAQEKVLHLFESGIPPRRIPLLMELPTTLTEIQTCLKQYGIDMSKYDQSLREKVVRDTRPVWQIARDTDVHPSIINHWKRAAKSGVVKIPRAEREPLYLKLEYQLLEMVVQGMTTAQIAEQIGYSVSAVGMFFYNIYKYRGVKNRTQWILQRRNMQ